VYWVGILGRVETSLYLAESWDTLSCTVGGGIRYFGWIDTLFEKEIVIVYLHGR